MSRKTIVLLLLLVAVPTALYLLWPSDEARIRKLVKESIEAVEKEDIDGVMDHVSYAYSDDHGLSYMLLKQNIQRRLNVYSEIEVECEVLEIAVKESLASARMNLLVLASMGQQRGYILGDLDESARVTLDLEKNPAGKWLITKAVLSPFDPGF